MVTRALTIVCTLGMVAAMRQCAKLLIVLLFWTTQASAWDSDNCQTDRVFDTVATVSDLADKPGQLNTDACGHCNHFSAHLIGYISSPPLALPLATNALPVSLSSFSPQPTIYLLFHPPRSFSL